VANGLKRNSGILPDMCISNVLIKLRSYALNLNFLGENSIKVKIVLYFSAFVQIAFIIATHKKNCVRRKYGRTFLEFS